MAFRSGKYYDNQTGIYNEADELLIGKEPQGHWDMYVLGPVLEYMKDYCGCPLRD